MEHSPVNGIDLEALHKKTFIHDYYPLALPLVIDDAMKKDMREALAKDVNGNAIIYGFFETYLTRMEAGGPSSTAIKKELEAAVIKAGVDLITLTLGNASRPLDDYDSILRSVAWWEKMFRAFPLIEKCTSLQEIDSLRRRGKTGLMYALQDMGCIGNELDRVDRLFGAGVRMGQLTYNKSNAIGSGSAEDPSKGLTPFGREAVKRMNSVGIVVDLSHCNTRTTLDGMEASIKPVAISHSSCKSVWNHARAKSNEELHALSECKGFFGLDTVPFFLTGDDDPDFSIFIKHLEHAIGIMGIDNVGVASDWGLWSPDIPPELVEASKAAAYKMGFSKDMKLSVGTSLRGMDDYTDWIRITEALVLAGFSKDQIAGILGGNYLGFLGRALPAGPVQAGKVV